MRPAVQHVIAAVLGVALAAAWYAPAADPAPQLTVPCRVVGVHDGDTLTVEVRMRVNVRLLDCWAPELSEPGGAEAKAKLRALTDGREGLLTVPLGRSLSDSWTFGRVLGRVYAGEDVSEAMVKSGHAKKTKAR